MTHVAMFKVNSQMSRLQGLVKIRCKMYDEGVSDCVGFNPLDT